MKNREVRENNKVQFYMALALTVILLLVVFTLGWLFYQRGLQLVTEVRSPDLEIWEGHFEGHDTGEQSYLMLNDIDASGGSTEKEYVFCVYGDTATDYVLQLGYTTNNPFTYEIYSAKEYEGKVASGTGGAIADPNGGAYYYEKITDADQETSTLAGCFLNRAETGIANDTYHNETFSAAGTGEAYGNVQKNAEPIYWKSTVIKPSDSSKKTDGSFVEYYILKIKWETGSITNNKETDMVYLIAGASAQ
jgi:hypothetical protein